MTKSIFYFIVLLLIVSCREKLDKKIVLFQNVELDNEEYKLYFFALESIGIKGFDNFYIEDKTTLAKIKNEWVFDEKSEVWACGYSYVMVLMMGDKMVFRKSINTDCEYLEGWIYFPKSYLTKHKKEFKKLTQKEVAAFQKKHNLFY